MIQNIVYYGHSQIYNPAFLNKENERTNESLYKIYSCSPNEWASTKR